MFLALTLLPQTLMAHISVQDCVSSIQKTWPSLSHRAMAGESRHRTDCRLEIEISNGQLDFSVESSPHIKVQFSLDSNTNRRKTITQCTVDKTRIHLVFSDEGSLGDRVSEKNQLTLIKKPGVGWSMITVQSKSSLFSPTQKNNLICGLI